MYREILQKYASLPAAESYLLAALRADEDQAKKVIAAAKREGLSLERIYLDILQPCMYAIGELWATRIISVGLEHVATAITQSVMGDAYADIVQLDKTGPVLVAACARGELHELGLRMVCDLLELSGWNVFYHGAGCDPLKVVASAAENKANILAFSATLPHNVSEVEGLIALVKQNGLGEVPILVGGLAFNLNSNLYKNVGADGFAPSASEVKDTALKLIKSGKNYSTKDHH